MGAFDKRVKQKENPKGQRVVQKVSPDDFYDMTPTWNFSSIDTEMWPFTKQHIGDAFWDEILPHLIGLESQTWKEILINSKKQNHSIKVEELNKKAQARLENRYIEAEALISLRISGTHRIYGYNNGRVFNLLWYDDGHGDNDSCVCRSKKKHT